MGTFAGFDPETRSLPVPSPLLGTLLEEINDVAELKCTLRFLWHVAQVRGIPKAVPAPTLESDGVLLAALGSAEEVRRGLGLARARGTLIAAAGRYLLHTPENRRAAERLGAPPEPVAREPVAVSETNVFALYEANIGLLTPMIADQLRQAEADFPVDWIAGAIREATERNVRNWRYISAILERWANEGRGGGTRGELGRHSEAATAAEYLRRRRTAD